MKKRASKEPDEAGKGNPSYDQWKRTVPTEEEQREARHKLEIRRARRSSGEWRRLAELLERENRELHEANDLLTGVLDPAPPIRNLSFPPQKRGGKNRSVAILGMGDNHIEEIVKPEWVLWKNEHRLDIGLERSRKYFENGERIYKYKSTHHKFVHAIAWQGGDHFTGHIRDEFKEITEVTPHEAIEQFVPLVVAGLRRWRQEFDCKTIDVLWSFSNHGRDRKEYSSTKEAEHSYDFLMAKMVKACMTDKNGKLESGFNFIIPRSYYYLIDLEGIACRFGHGHKVKYRGGVGGVMIPLMRKLTRLNSTLPADIDFVQHFHQELNTPFLGIGGSGIGYTPYAMNELAAPFEIPKQSFWTIDMERRVKRFDPIYLTKVKRSDPT